MSADETNEAERLGVAGKTIDELYVGPEEAYLVLVVGGERIVWDTDSDCCSETWFADIKGVNRLIGHRVLAVSAEDAENDPEDGRTRQESDTVQTLRFTTDAGEAEIIWRNSSNGYYGGSVFWPQWAEIPEWYRRVKHPEPDDVLTRVTDDWSAPGVSG